jgi:cytochrome P450
MISKLLKDSIQDGVDLQPLFFRLTLHTTTAVLFGRTSDSLTSIGGEDEEVFADAFNAAQHELAQRGRLGDLYWLIGGSKFRNDCKTVHRYVDEIVHAALEDDKKRDKDKDGSSQYIFLAALMTRTKNPIELRDQLINVLLAGRDTTGCLLSWTL